MNYAPEQLARWILSNVAADIASQAGEEFRFPCPRCGHKAHYFNVKKGVGYCHHASCKATTTVQNLEKYWGKSPQSAIVGFTKTIESTPSTEQEVLTLPEKARALIIREEGRLLSYFPDVVTEIQRSRFITPEQMFRWSLHIDPEDERIIIPVFGHGILQNYVSRSIWWEESKTSYKRYKYPRGRNIKDWIFGWDEAKRWTELSLVENTFNAIWLRNHLYCTTAFGSDLSKKQIKDIQDSKATKITFLWDYGAEVRAQKAIDRLKYVSCRMVRLTKNRPQPDDWTVEELQQKVEEVWNA